MAYGHCPEAIGQIVAHWCVLNFFLFLFFFFFYSLGFVCRSFENPSHSEGVVSLLLSGIDKSANDNIKPYFDVMKRTTFLSFMLACWLALLLFKNKIASY